MGNCTKELNTSNRNRSAFRLRIPYAAANLAESNCLIQVVSLSWAALPGIFQPFHENRLTKRSFKFRACCRLL